ncbi:MAG: GTPase Era, partial [spirochete symbiont of Stewartia floridana]
MKSGFAAIVGRPSAGKSTLLNALCGEKAAITSPAPQTTRNVIRGIVNFPEGQVVFLDTPGYHQSEKKFNSYLRRIVHRTLDEADIILYVIDGTRMPGQEEFSIMKILSRVKAPIIAAVNKIDAAPKYLPEIRGLIRMNINPAAIINISALKAAHLDVLTAAVIDICPEGDI